MADNEVPLLFLRKVSVYDLPEPGAVLNFRYIFVAVIGGTGIYTLPSVLHDDRPYDTGELYCVPVPGDAVVTNDIKLSPLLVGTKLTPKLALLL